MVKRKSYVHRHEDFTGKQFNHWTVLHKSYKYRNGHARLVWKCRCVCGKESFRTSQDLKWNKSRSCGCVNRNKQINPNAAFNIVYNQYKQLDKKAGRVFPLSKDEFRNLTQQVCFYCGIVPSNKRNSKAGLSYIYNGIDRVDNSKGHTSDNIVTCCGICNSMKQDYSQRDFFEKIIKIYRRHCQKPTWRAA